MEEVDQERERTAMDLVAIRAGVLVQILAATVANLVAVQIKVAERINGRNDRFVAGGADLLAQTFVGAGRLFDDLAVIREAVAECRQNTENMMASASQKQMYIMV